ncbi:MAG: phospholipase, partial [Planctomycetota bacterium]
MQTKRILFKFALQWSLLLSIALLGASTLQAQTEPVKTGFVNAVYQDAAGEHRYVVFVPRNYSPEKKYPVILFLHGAGERGSDGLKQTQIGL